MMNTTETKTPTASAASAPEAETASAKGGALVLIVTSLAVLLVPFTLTGLSVSMNAITEELRAGPSGVQWIVTGYSATFAGFILLFGALADRQGPRRIFAFGTAVFSVCGLASALAQNILVLDVARFFSGIGAAGALAGASALIAKQFTGAARAKAFGIFGTSIGIGLATGPTVSGVIDQALGWRGVLAVPVVVGFALLFAIPALPSDAAKKDTPLDVLGAVTFTLSLLSFIVFVIEGSSLGWGSPLVVGSLVSAAVLLGVFVAVEKRTEHPLVDFRATLTRPFLAACWTVIATLGFFAAMLVYLPTYFRTSLGLSPSGSGLLVFAFTGPTLVLPAICGWLTKFVSPRVQIAICLVVTAAGCVWFASGGPVWLSLLVAGSGIAMGQGLLDALAVSATPHELVGTTSGAFNTVKLTGETIGIAIVGSALATMTQGQFSGPQLPHALHALFVVMAGLAFLSILGIDWLLRPRGELPAEAAGQPEAAEA